jgi:hypothetical protein
MEDAVTSIRAAALPLLGSEEERVSFDIRPSTRKGFFDMFLGGSVHTFSPKQIEWTAKDGSWAVLVEGALKRLRRRVLNPEPVFHLEDVYTEVQASLVAIIKASGGPGSSGIIAREEAGLDGLSPAARLKVINERLAAWIAHTLKGALEAAVVKKEAPEPPRRARRVRQLAKVNQEEKQDGGS